MVRKKKNFLDYWASEDDLVAHVNELLEEPLFKYMGAFHVRNFVEFDPEFAVRFRETHRKNEAERKIREREISRAQAPLWAELEAAGLLEYTEASPEGWIPEENIESAFPLLMKWFPHVDNSYARHRIIGRLNSPVAVNWIPELLSFFRNYRRAFPDINFGDVDLAIGDYMGKEHLVEVLDIALDSSFGGSRSWMVHNLWRYFDDPRVEPVLMKLVSEPDCPAIQRNSLYALRRVGKPSYRAIFERHLDHSNSGVRKIAREGIEKVDKAVARSEGRAIPKKEVKKREPKEPLPWPRGLPHDALVTLIFTDLLQLETLSVMSRADLRQMRGIGPKAIERIELELEAKGLAPLTD